MDTRVRTSSSLSTISREICEFSRFPGEKCAKNNYELEQREPFSRKIRNAPILTWHAFSITNTLCVRVCVCVCVFVAASPCMGLCARVAVTYTHSHTQPHTHTHSNGNAPLVQCTHTLCVYKKRACFETLAATLDSTGAASTATKQFKCRAKAQRAIKQSHSAIFACRSCAAGATARLGVCGGCGG